MIDLTEVTRSLAIPINRHILKSSGVISSGRVMTPNLSASKQATWKVTSPPPTTGTSTASRTALSPKFHMPWSIIASKPSFSP